MTEMTVNKGKIKANLWMPRPRPARYLIDPVAFLIALIGGPLMVTLMSFWALFIPVFALFIGGPLYLIAGTPLLLIYLRATPGDTGDIITMAFFAVLAIVPVGFGVAAFSGDMDVMGLVFGITLFGLIFGPLWAWGFGWIYFRLRRDLYARPLPTHF